MAETLKNIVQNSDDLFFVDIDKKDPSDRSTWKFSVTDSRWKGDSMDDCKFHIVHLRRGNNFFLAYKPYQDGNFNYFVNKKGAMLKTSIPKYVNSLIRYSVYSNDISTVKNAPSFKVTQMEMKKLGIDNFLDLCYHYRRYSAIGTGYTRNVRNLVVMDIDVDCTKDENREDLDNLLITFSKYNALPDFYIFNKESKHVQLQWLVQNFPYKEIDDETKKKVIDELINDSKKTGEINYKGTDFTKISEAGINYRKFTLAFCGIVDRRKFGDRNYTFWKAKNPMAAFRGLYNLELKIPYISNGQIKYQSREWMEAQFADKDARKEYFDEAPDVNELHRRLAPLIDPLMKKVSIKTAMKWDDGIDVKETKEREKKAKKKSENPESGRNDFVFNCTRETTGDTAFDHGYKDSEALKRLEKSEYAKFRKCVYDQVVQKFKDEDRKYCGVWPGTSNHSQYTKEEFDKTFSYSFNWTINNYEGMQWSDDDRAKSLRTRHARMDMNLILVDKIRTEENGISRKKLLEEVNRRLVKANHKKISMGTLKRYISDLKGMDDDGKKCLYEEWKSNLDERKRQLDEVKKNKVNQNWMDTKKKRYEYLNMDF